MPKLKAFAEQSTDDLKAPDLANFSSGDKKAKQRSPCERMYLLMYHHFVELIGSLLHLTRQLFDTFVDTGQRQNCVLLSVVPLSASLDGIAPSDLGQRVKLFFGSVLYKDFNETRRASLLEKLGVFVLGRIFTMCLVCVCVFSLVAWLLWFFVFVSPGAES